MSILYNRDLTGTHYFRLKGRFVIHSNSPFLRIMDENERAVVDILQGMAGLSYSAILEMDGYIIYEENSEFEYLATREKYEDFTFKML